MLSDFNESHDSYENEDISPKELSEAIEAGEKALDSLNEARDSLSSASSWGIFDIIGGGGITSMIKHSKMRDAKYLMEQATKDLKRFYKELGDIHFEDKLDIETDDFFTFADTFFDSLVFDVLVQTRISDSKRKIEEAIEKVEKLLDKLNDIED